MASREESQLRAAPEGVEQSSERGSSTLDLILAASTQLFSERGYAAASMRELAERAQLPLSSFYYYFRSKYDVLLAIMDGAHGRLETAGAEALASTSEPAAQLEALVGGHIKVHLEQPAAARVGDTELRALRDDDRVEIVARRDSYEQHFRDVLAAGVASGDFDPDLDVRVAGMAILTMATSVIDWWRPDGRFSIEETAAIFGRYAVGIARSGS